MPPAINMPYQTVMQRTEEIFQDNLAKLNASTDKVFSLLLILQWIFCTILVLFVSPRTWIGDSSSVHIHLWGSLLLGALLTVYPVWLALFHSQDSLTRHVIGIAQMGWSALLIHVTGGRIETHFHVFGSLAFLAFYRDWKVMCTATVVVALDHMLRGIWWPQSVFGIAHGAEWRWVEHAAWVVFEDVFLIAACLRGMREMRDYAAKQASLEQSYHFTELEVQQRTQELVKANMLADAASRAKSEFLANMSHEIRTPLTAILGYADILRDESGQMLVPEQRVQTVETIRSAGQHLLTVINDILDLSKIEADKMTIECVDTPLIRVLGEVESLIRPRAAGKGVNLMARLATPIPDRILSDPTRLRQILMNLTGNAAKFTQAGSVMITASVQKNEDETSRLVIDVEDTGPGLTSDQAEGLFAAFVQADNTVCRQHGGTGLGLNISRRLARLMGGDVTLAWSHLGEGSCFRIELPLIPAAGAKEVSSLEVLCTEPRQRSKDPLPALVGKILLAEDGPDNQRLISYYLRKAGAEVDIADNGAIALDMFEKALRIGQPYDLLLSDMQMPEMDGYTLARTLRNREYTIAIVALTAHAMAEDRKKCLEAGCNDYASKPVDRKSLLETCRRWMQNASHFAPTQVTSNVT